VICIANDVGSKELQPYFMPYQIETELLELEFADFAFIGNGELGPVTVGVERKSLSDMLACVRDSRFSGHQRDGMLRNYEIVYLIVEGMYRCDSQTGILQQWRRGGWQDVRLGTSKFMHSELQRFLITLTSFTRFRVWQTRSDHVEDTVLFIADLYRQLAQKKFEDHKSLTTVHMPEIREPVLLRKLTAAEENEAIRRMVVMSLKCGIGQDKSKAVAQAFESVQEMANADVDRWRRIEGIGKTLAGNAVATITNINGKDT
jgi:ERCC4-type nuclease